MRLSQALPDQSSEVSPTAPDAYCDTTGHSIHMSQLLASFLTGDKCL